MSMSIEQFEAQRPQRPAGWYTDPLGGTTMRWWDGTEWTKDSDELFGGGLSRGPRPLPDTWIAHATRPRRTAGDIAMSTLGIALTSIAVALGLGLLGFALV